MVSSSVVEKCSEVAENFVLQYNSGVWEERAWKYGILEFFPKITNLKLVLITCVHPESSLRSFDVARTSKCLFFNILGIKCNEMQNELYYFSLCLSPCQRLSAVHGAVYAMQQAFNEVAPMCVDVFHHIPKPNNVAWLTC